MLRVTKMNLTPYLCHLVANSHRPIKRANSGAATAQNSALCNMAAARSRASECRAAV